MLLHGSYLFGILTIEVRSALLKQPLVGSAYVLRVYALAQPGLEQVVGRITAQGLFELLACNLPPLHNALVHRAWIDVIVYGSGEVGAGFIGEPQQPECIADRLPAAARKGLSIAKIGRHAPYNARGKRRVAHGSRANGAYSCESEGRG